MREARVILPMHDNDGRSLEHVHTYLKQQLCLAFGGYTAIKSFGGWMDRKTGKLFEDESTTYDVACDDTQVNHDVLLGLAQILINLASQEAIYLRLPNGDVQIVEPELARGVA